MKNPAQTGKQALMKMRARRYTFRAIRDAMGADKCSISLLSYVENDAPDKRLNERHAAALVRAAKILK